MWGELREQVAVERQMLRRLLQDHRPLIVKCETIEPDRIELSALAAMLHCFYSGIENVFRRIAVELGEQPAKDRDWHKRLLDAMTRGTSDRPAVISSKLADDLEEYLRFRHVFRQAYVFHLRWDRMEPLVRRCHAILERFETEVQAFLQATEDRQ